MQPALLTVSLSSAWFGESIGSGQLKYRHAKRSTVSENNKGVAD
jgi:hypothetical protein